MDHRSKYKSNNYETLKKCKNESFLLQNRQWFLNYDSKGSSDNKKKEVDMLEK